MASNAKAGVGTEFRRWGGSVFTKIAEVNSISGPNRSRDVIDVTSLDSTGGYREYIPGFKDGGTIQLTMNFTNSTYEQMDADFESDDVQYYEIVLPDDDTTTLEFEGYVTELPLEIPPDDKITATVTIKITGEVLVNKGSGSGGS